MVDDGIDAHLNYNLTPTAMEFAFRNSSMVYSHSDGGDTYIKLGSRYLNYSAIDSGSLANADLIYISAPYSGGTFCSTLFQTGGADVVIGFDGNVTTVNDKLGISYFDERFFMYYFSGSTIQQAINSASYDTLITFGEYYGCNSIHLYS